MPCRYSLPLLLSTFSFFASAQENRDALLQEYRHLDSACVAMDFTNLPLLLEKGKRMYEIARVLQIDTLVLNANQLQGQVLESIGVFDAALKIHYESLALAEKNKHCTHTWRSLTMIARVFQTMGDYEKSLEFGFKAKQAAIQCKSYRDTIYLNYEIGFNKAKMGDWAGGIKLIEQNLQVAKNISSSEDIFFGYDNLANMFFESDKPEKALEYALELLKIPEAWEGDFEKAQVFQHFAEIYAKLKDWDNAQKYQQEALDIATTLGMNDWIYECYKVQSWIDEGRGDYKSALKNHQLYLTLKDSVYQDQYKEKIAAMSALYELESKQKTISLLEKDQQLKSVQIEEQRILMLVGLLALSLLILAIRFHNQWKTNRMREAFSQDLINAQEQERQRISKELHDSVGQNILFVKNRLQRLSPAPEAALVDSVDAALQEVRNIAKDLYPNQLEQYGLGSAVDSLCELAQESSGIFASSDLQGIDEKLSREAKINCYRIVQECINNTLKHAEASAIRISSNLHPDKVELVVQDNGKGFDKTLLEQTANRSFGMINMAERIKMLRGKLDLDTGVQKGTRLTFSIPISA